MFHRIRARHPAPKAQSAIFRRSVALLSVTSLTMAIAILPSTIASAATQTVTITANGYVPISSSIATGDSVTFVNGDIAVHQVVFTAKSGVTCTPKPLVLQPTATGSCTFQHSGTYSYSDPNVKAKTFSGTVIVSATPPSVALAVSPGVATYGHTETLSGKTSDPSSGQSVQILAQSCGQTSATSTGTVTTTTGGSFTLQRKPLINTTYSAKVKSATSNQVLAGVIPWQQLTKTSLHHFSLRVSASSSFAGKYVTFQRYSSAVSRWVNVRTVTLRANSSGTAPTVISSATFTSTVARTQKVRTVLGAVQVGSCYLPGVSNAIFN